ncbi:hypothetical protein BC830DRAFT_1170176 [Chytriomyces sp. MP71]|nr:hypothetical protein BC830DRAFT_1170176 [Chytriomyces sp. MP71]
MSDSREPDTISETAPLLAWSKTDHASSVSADSRLSSLSHAPPASLMPATVSPLQKQVGEFLESKEVHWAVIFMTFLDLAIVLAEIVFSLESKCGGLALDDPMTTLSQGALETLEFLHEVSTVILFIMAGEISARLFAFGPQYFVSSSLHSFDAAVVFLSLFIDLVLEGYAEGALSLLIIFRAWRVVRVVDAVVLTVGEQAQEKIDLLEKEVAELKKELHLLKAGKDALVDESATTEEASFLEE